MTTTDTHQLTLDLPFEPEPNRTDLRLTAIAPHGAWTMPAAQKAGIPRRAARGRIAAGRWVLAAGRAYADPTAADDLRVRVAAAQLNWPDAVVWGRTAGILHGLPIEDDRIVHMATPKGRGPLFRMAPHEVVVLDEPVHLGGARVTSRRETIADCIATLPDTEAHGLLAWVFTRDLITTDEFTEQAEMRWGRRGAARVRTYAAMAARGALSKAEDAFHDLLQAAGITEWIGNPKIRDSHGTIVAVPDVLFPEQRLIVEIDGEAFHTDDDKDRRRDALLIALGYRIIHLTPTEFALDPDGVVERIRMALAAAAA